MKRVLIALLLIFALSLALCLFWLCGVFDGDTPGGDAPGGDTPGGDTPGGDTPGGDDSGDEDGDGCLNTPFFPF